MFHSSVNDNGSVQGSSLVRTAAICKVGCMNLDHIRERLHNGFEPFVMTTTDGRRFEVPHQDFVAVGRNVVVVLDEKDHSAKIDALHIVSIEDLPTKKRK